MENAMENGIDDDWRPDPNRLALYLLDMAQRFDAWRHFDQEIRAREGLSTTASTCIMGPPSWPSHMQLARFSQVLRVAAAATPKKDDSEDG